MTEQPTDPQTETTEPQTPITVGDVLRAVFLPPRDGAEPDLSALRGIPAPWQRPAPPAEPLEADEVLAPPVVTYVEGPPAPARDVTPTRIAVLGLGTLATLLIAVLAQTALAVQGRHTVAVVLYALAGLSWVGLLVTEFGLRREGLLARGPQVTGSAAYPVERPRPEWLSARALVTVAALLLSVATYLLTANNSFTLPGVAAWVLSVALWMVAAAERSPADLLAGWRERLSRTPQAVRSIRPPRLLPLLALLAVLGAAAFFRFYRLGAIPVEMTSDHVEKVLDAFAVSQGLHSVFFRANGGREAVQFYLIPIAASLTGTGMSFLTLKLVTAVEGLLLIPLVVWLGRELVDRETGFLAAALVAISWWHVVLSRLALRIVLTPLFFTVVVVLLVRGVRTGSRRAWLWAGFWMGAGVYGYQAMRITPLVAAAAFVIGVAGPVTRWLLAEARGRAGAPVRRAAAHVVERQGLNLVLAGLVALAIFVPMLRVWHDYPDDLWARVVNRTTESERAIEDEPLDILFDNYRHALGMYNVRGDVAWISAVPHKPLMDRVSAGLLVLGLMAWGARLYTRRDPADAFLLAAGLIMLLPSALAIAFPIENPSATRASGTLPIVYLLAAWPLALIRQRWSAVLGRVPGSALAAVLIAVLLGGAAVLNFDAYFEEYDASYRAAALNPGQVAAEVREIVGPETPLEGVWLQGWPHWHDYRAIGIEAGEVTFDNAILDVARLEQVLQNNAAFFADWRPLVFIVHPDDAEALAVLRREFPGGEARHHTGSLPGRDFVLFVVPEE